MTQSNILAKLIEELYALDPGVLIDSPYDFVYFSNIVRISRRGLKHVVEMRKDDKYSVSRIQEMCLRASLVFDAPDLCIKNMNERYPDSYISAKLYDEDKKALLVVHYCRDGQYIDIITMFYRSKEKFERMLDQK